MDNCSALPPSRRQDLSRSKSRVTCLCPAELQSTKNSSCEVHVFGSENNTYILKESCGILVIILRFHVSDIIVLRGGISVGILGELTGHGA